MAGLYFLNIQCYPFIDQLRALKYIKMHIHITVDIHTDIVKVDKCMLINKVKISVKEYFIKHLLIYIQIQNMNLLKNINTKKTFYLTWKK